MGIEVEVVYALPGRQQMIVLQVPEGCTAFAAAQRSGITREFADLDLAHAAMGIFGQRLADPATHVLRAGDRVEIYRPLGTEPKEARKARARKARAARAQKT